MLQDLSQLEDMGLDCTLWIGRMMDLLNERGVSQVVRVLPDPAKDIGFNILTVFHYRPTVEIIACKAVTQAAPYLA